MSIDYWHPLLQPELQSRSRPEPAFLAGAGARAEKITKFRLWLLVNCKAENYEFVTTKKIFSSLIQNYRIYMFNFRTNRAQRTSSLSLERLSN